MSVKLKNAFGALVVLSVFTTFIFTLHLYRTPPSRAFGTSTDFEALALDSLAAAKGSSRFSADLKEFLLGDVVRTSKDSEALSPHVVNAPKEFRSSGDLRGHLTSDDTQEDSEEDTKEGHQEDPEESDFQALHREMGIGGKAVVRPKERERKGPRMVRTDSGESFVEGMFYTHDDWPKFSSKVYKNRAPKTPYDPPHAIQWDFNVSAFLQRPEVKGRPPKLITWMAPMKYLPKITEPVRLRTCPGMPCRMTTNVQYRQKSAALIWNVENIRGVNPPARPHPDQVFIFHNQERPEHHHMAKSTYRTSAWRSVFNWTMSFRFDSDILDVYGYLSKRPVPLVKNYTAIMARKTKMASWIVSHCKTTSRREEYVDIFQKYIPVDIYAKRPVP
ncbi:uncharacterized protein, partial [Littorina saxatilis]|uniref:uncharacterized protein n=1 Tax=Littorina saxatilis TaxID=31220 RepID=UPI0038B42F8A